MKISEAVHRSREDLSSEVSDSCDLALKIDGRPVFLIEVKSVGTGLKDNHLRQAIDYAANSGIEWVLLTNGIEWQAHRLRFEKPIDADEVFSIDLLLGNACPSGGNAWATRAAS